MKLLTGSRNYGAPTVAETVDGKCPVCHHKVPRELNGFITCPCGARVHLSGRSDRQVRLDTLKSLGA